MGAPASIFLDSALPNATTWFYFSALLAIALFFKFSRLLSVRNLDVLTLFLLVPGLLLLREARGNWFGYLWLLCGSGYLLFRCLLDLTLVRRPALSPNLSPGGLGWLSGSLFVCLVAVAVPRADAPPEQMVGKHTPALDEAQRRAKDLVEKQAVAPPAEEIDTEVWVGHGLAVLCHLAVVVGLVCVGWRHFQDVHVGTAAAAFYLLLPYTAYHVGQVHHVWPAALLVWAVFAYRRPTLSGFLLGLAAGTAYFPVVALPAWLGFYWKRGAGRFAASFALTTGLCVAAVVGVLWTDGELAQSLYAVLKQADWQPWKPPGEKVEGFWTGDHWVYRFPVFLAYLAFVLTTAFWPSPKNLAHVLALTAAALIGIQFWYADQGGVYVLWYLPLLLLLTFRPNLEGRRPPPINRETDWLWRLGRALGRLAWRLVRPPEPLVRV